MTIYERSWYGRVLVERVEGYARPEEWGRASLEINDFEQQLRRFREREEVAWKRHRIGPEDWRNREKWGLYRDAVNDMVAHTSTAAAPWTLVPGNDKRFARIRVIETLCDRLRPAPVATRPMTKVGRAKEKGATQGFMKILVDEKTREILGASILGVEGDEAIHSILDVMYARQPYTVIQRAVHIHPTVSELIPTLLGGLKSLAPGSAA